MRGVFAAYPWPGNVRQLQNVIRNIVVLNEGERVTADMLPAPLDQLVGTVEPLPASPQSAAPVLGGSGGSEAAAPTAAAATGTSPGGGRLLAGRAEDIRPLDEMEREIIEHAINLCGDNVPKAAAHLGISASTIYRKRQGWEGEA